MMPKKTPKETGAIPRKALVWLIVTAAVCLAALIAVTVIAAKRDAPASAEPEAPAQTEFPADYTPVYPDGYPYADLDPDAYIRLGDYKGLTVTRTIGSKVTETEVRAAVNAALAAEAKDGVSPAYDDAFVQARGYADKAAYESALRAALEAGRPMQIEEEKRTAALCAVIENASLLSYPANAVEDEIAETLSGIRSLAKQYGMSYADLISQATGLSVTDYEADVRTQAEYAVKRALALRAVAKAEGINAAEDALYTAVTDFLVKNTTFIGAK